MHETNIICDLAVTKGKTERSIELRLFPKIEQRLNPVSSQNKKLSGKYLCMKRTLSVI